MTVSYTHLDVYKRQVQLLEIAGATCDAQKIYTVASAGSQDIKSNDKEDTGVHAIDALRRYLAASSPVNAELTGSKFVAI